jgi:biotin transport system substrate-specific component
MFTDTVAANPTARPLIQRVIRIENDLLRTALQISLGIVFLALLAQVRVEIGAVPITGQTLGVLLLGAAYGVGLGAATMVGYFLVGGLGLGVFAGGGAGFSTFAGTTGGYLFGFLAAAVLVGYLASRGWDRTHVGVAAAMVLGNLVIYAFGLAWLAQFAPDFQTALAWGLLPFLAGDAVKIAIAVALLPLAWRLLGKRRDA